MIISQAYSLYLFPSPSLSLSLSLSTPVSSPTALLYPLPLLPFSLLLSTPYLLPLSSPPLISQPCVNNGTCDSATGMCQCTDYTAGLFSNNSISGILLVNMSMCFQLQHTIYHTFHIASIYTQICWADLFMQQFRELSKEQPELHMQW